jgi:hypothetical protein
MGTVRRPPRGVAKAAKEEAHRTRRVQADA